MPTAVLNQDVPASDDSTALDAESSEPVEEPCALAPEADESTGNGAISAGIAKSTSNDAVDFLASPMPLIELELLSERLFRYVAATIAFISVFTVVFYHGITVDTVYEVVGTATKKSDERVESYNGISGYVMALIEVFLAMHVDQFMPVLNVYVHNSLFFLRQRMGSPQRIKRSRQLHTTLMFLFPIVLTLTMDNSLRGLQASHSITGVKSIMSAADLKKEQSLLELIKANVSSKGKTSQSVADTILRNAIRQQSEPFSIDSNSACSLSVLKNEDIFDRVSLAAHTVDTSSVIYGFFPREWNREAIPFELVPASNFTISAEDVARAKEANEVIDPPTNFSIQTAYEMLVQAQIQIERAQGEAAQEPYECRKSDGQRDSDRAQGEWYYDKNGKRLCDGAPTSLFGMASFNDRMDARVEDLVQDTGNILVNTFPIAREYLTLMLETYQLTPQIRVEAMRIDVPMDNSVEYELDYCLEESCSEKIYSFRNLSDLLCGSDGCAFIDDSGAFLLGGEIGVVPYFTNCTLGADGVHYSELMRGFYPSSCTRASDTAFLYGFGSYIRGDEYGTNDVSLSSRFDLFTDKEEEADFFSDESNKSGAPFIINPRRYLRLTFAKVTWATTDLAKKFKASCAVDKQHSNCSGIWYELEQSGRYLFAGEDALPTQKLALAEFHSPIALVQLKPSAFLGEGIPVSMERLSSLHFDTSNWKLPNGDSGATLNGPKCSRLIDSYLKHVESNHYYLEYPLQAMYTSFFYFFMENAAVTQLREGLIGPFTEDEDKDKLTRDALGNAKLQGDVQVRIIRVLIPKDAFRSTFGACIAIAVMVLIIVAVPVKLAEYFDADITIAKRFVALRKGSKYPNEVYDKTLVNTTTDECVRFEDVKIESMTLVHKTESDRVVYL